VTVYSKRISGRHARIVGLVWSVIE
jgi:hypothetical protein